jgi:hypothetical protein
MTLVGSVLLLCAVSSSPFPSHRQTPEPSETASIQPGKSQPHGSSIHPSYISLPAKQRRAPVREEQHGGESIIITVFTIISGLATAAMAWFNYQLVGVTAEMKKATGEAAEAARQNARAADASLHVYRPFLIVRSVSVDPSTTDSMIPEKFKIEIRNDGIGPADILRVHMEGQIFPWNGRDEPRPEYEPESGWTPIESIVAAGEGQTLPGQDIPRWFDVTADEFREMRGGTKRLGLHGVIFYRGGPEKEYWTRFFWWYLVDSVGSSQPNIVRANRLDVNAHT